MESDCIWGHHSSPVQLTSTRSDQKPKCILNALLSFRQVKDQNKKVANLKHKEQVEKKKSAQMLEEARRREDNLNDSSQQLQVTWELDKSNMANGPVSYITSCCTCWSIFIAITQWLFKRRHLSYSPSKKAAFLFSSWKKGFLLSVQLWSASLK